MKVLIRISNRSLIASINNACQVFFLIDFGKGFAHSGPSTACVTDTGRSSHPLSVRPPRTSAHCELALGTHLARGPFTKRSAGFPALCCHGLQRIGGKKQHDRAHQGHAEKPAAVQFIEAAVASSKTNFLRRKTFLCAKRDFFYVT